MKYTAVIKAAINPDIAYEVLLQEQDKTFERAKWSMEKEDKILKITIESKDAPALRALFNNITRSLAIIEETL